MYVYIMHAYIYIYMCVVQKTTFIIWIWANLDKTFQETCLTAGERFWAFTITEINTKLWNYGERVHTLTANFAHIYWWLSCYSIDVNKFWTQTGLVKTIIWNHFWRSQHDFRTSKFNIYGPWFESFTYVFQIGTAWQWGYNTNLLTLEHCRNQTSKPLIYIIRIVRFL